MKNKNKNNFPVYLFGGKTTDDLLGEYLMQRQLASADNPGSIQNPNEALAQNNLALARADQKANNNFLSQGLDIFGSLALSAGTNMMQKGIAAGQTFETGGKVKKDKKQPKGIIRKIYKAKDDEIINPTELLMELYTEQMMGRQKTMVAATGGKVPVEAEGKEIVETPDGDVTELVGPSHENGGIELLLPEGTEIFSKRLRGSDGKTMAERKKSRERQARKMQKLYDNNPSDTTLKKTLDKTLANNEAQEQADVALMEQARQHYNAGIERMMGGLIEEQMATGGRIYKEGGTVVGNFLRSLFGGNSNVDPETGFDPDYAARQLGKFTSDNASNQTGILDTDEIPGVTDFSYNDKVGKGKRPKTATNPFNVGDLFGEMPTLGDGIGIAGNLISTFGPKKNTLANRAGDTPNINAYKDYGKEGLEVLDSTKQYVAGQRDNNLQDLELSRSSAIRRGRNSARGVNTQRALDIATNASVNDAKSKVYNTFASQMMNILGKQAGMENQQDQVVMRGEQARDLADRQDRDNFYSQLAQDIATQGTGLQHLGKNVNSIKERGVMSEILDDFFENYSINHKTGKTKFKKDK